MYQKQHFIIYWLPSKINIFKVIKVFCDILAIIECQLNIETNSLESRQFWKHEKQVEIIWNKKEIQDTTTFYFVMWVLKPNNNISHFLQSILHTFSSMGHLLVSSFFYVPIFLGLLLGISFIQFYFLCLLQVVVSIHYS
jgi:hypothetical protein